MVYDQVVCEKWCVTMILTHHLSHTISHTPSLTHHHLHYLSHTIFHIPALTHHLSSFTDHLLHTATLCVARVALDDNHLRFARQAWHLWHWACSGGALGLGLVAGDAAALCVAGVALGDMCLRFTWQAWHLATSTCGLRDRRGTYGTGLALVRHVGWD